MSPLNNLHGRVLVVNGRGAAPAVVARESVGADPAGGLDAQAGGCRTRVGQGHPRGPWMTSAAPFDAPIGVKWCGSVVVGC